MSLEKGLEKKMNKRKMKRIDKKIKYAVFKNYFDNVSPLDNSLEIKPVPAFIKYSSASIEELKIKAQVLKRDMRKLAFLIKNSKNAFDTFNNASMFSILWGMELATNDYIKRMQMVS